MTSISHSVRISQKNILSFRSPPLGNHPFTVKQHSRIRAKMNICMALCKLMEAYTYLFKILKLLSSIESFSKLSLSGYKMFCKSFLKVPSTFHRWGPLWDWDLLCLHNNFTANLMKSCLQFLIMEDLSINATALTFYKKPLERNCSSVFQKIKKTY